MDNSSKIETEAISDKQFVESALIDIVRKLKPEMEILEPDKLKLDQATATIMEIVQKFANFPKQVENPVLTLKKKRNRKINAPADMRTSRRQAQLPPVIIKNVEERAQREHGSSISPQEMLNSGPKKVISAPRPKLQVNLQIL